MAFLKSSAYVRSDDRRVFSFDSFSGGARLGAENEDGGGNVSYLANMVFSGGKPTTRKGQELAFQTIYGRCGGSVSFGGALYMKMGIYLYKIDYSQSASPVAIEQVGTGGCVLFTFGGRLYMLSAHGYHVYDGTSSRAVTPYVPVVAVDRSADGSTSAPYESFNLIGRGFSVWFNYSGNGTYLLPVGDLADDAISVTLNGADVSADCSFDRAAGTVTVSGHGDPADEGLNNLRVTAYIKESDAAAERAKITGCTVSEVFGGNDGRGTRVFLAGNPSYPNHVFRSGLLDPTYFPDTDYEIVGTEGDPITAMKKQYGELVVLCERSVYAVDYLFSEGETVFSCRTVNPGIGCDAPGSVQLVNNNVVFANSKKGVFLICSKASDNENNVVPISANVEGTSAGLAACGSDAVKAAFSADWDGKYWLCLSGKCYIWDYGMRSYESYRESESAQKKLCWYVFTGTDMQFPAEYNHSLYFATPEGRVAYYGSGTTDFGRPFDAVMITSESALGAPLLEKKIYRTDFYYRSQGETTVSLKTVCDGDVGGAANTVYLRDDGGYAMTPKHAKIRSVLPKATRCYFEIRASGAVTFERLDVRFRA